MEKVELCPVDVNESVYEYTSNYTVRTESRPAAVVQKQRSNLSCSMRLIEVSYDMAKAIFHALYLVISTHCRLAAYCMNVFMHDQM